MPKTISPSIVRRICAAYPDMQASKVNDLLRKNNINTPAQFDAAYTLESFATLYGATYAP